MSVVGIDLGSQTCYIAVARAGGIETVANEYSDRCTPTYVSFSDKTRCMGVSAKNQCITNFKNTACGFTRLIGRTFSDPQTQHEIKRIPCQMGNDGEDNPVYQLQYMGEQQQFTTGQMTSMLFSKLKEIAEAALKSKVNDVVVSVPTYYTDLERRAMLDACQTAGLNCLRLMNDTTAVALAYGIYKQDLPEEKEKSRNVVFVDLGYSSLQVAACALNKGKLKMTAVSCDHNLGGRDFDQVLIDHAIEEIKTKYKIDPRTNPKAYLKVKQEMEKVKKLLSSNSQPIPYNLECLMEDKDVTGRVDRQQFEELAANLLTRVEATMRGVLDHAKLNTGDLYSVEIIGGACRIPAVKSLVTKVFGMEPSTTLNSDEAVSRGCALQCAISSPTFRVRDFSIADCQMYPITLQWQGGLDDDNSLEVFPRFHNIPFSKMLTFYRTEAFQLDAKYSYPDEIPHPKKNIGSFTIKNVVPQENGESSKVKVKVRVESNGTFEIKSATMVEKQENQAEVESQESMDVDEEKKEVVDKEESKDKDETKMEEASSETKPPENDENTESQETKTEKPEEKEKSAEKKKKKKVKVIDLPIKSIVPQLTKEEINQLVEKESQMIMQDKLERERSEAKNAVEEYVYDMRDKLFGTLEQFAKEEDRSHLSQLLTSTEDWLYDEGEDQQKQVYIDKLAELKKLGQPIADRYSESLERPVAFDSLGRSLQLVQKFLNARVQKDEKYDHLEDADVEKVQKCYKEKYAWYESKLNAQTQKKKHEPPVVLTNQIKNEQKALESSCIKIINKPKPKAEPPVEEKTKETKEAEPAKSTEETLNEKSAESAENEVPKDMEVD